MIAIREMGKWKLQQWAVRLISRRVKSEITVMSWLDINIRVDSLSDGRSLNLSQIDSVKGQVQILWFSCAGLVTISSK